MNQQTTYIVPCGAQKTATAAPARDLYVGAMFRHTLASALEQAAAEEEPGRVLILSAKHGLVELDTVLQPYEQTIGAAGAISAEALAKQAQALGIDWDSRVHCMLPAAYFARLDDALRSLDCYASNVYEVAGGIGEQRGINRLSRESAAAPAPVITDAWHAAHEAGAAGRAFSLIGSAA